MGASAVCLVPLPSAPGVGVPTGSIVGASAVALGVPSSDGPGSAELLEPEQALSARPVRHRTALRARATRCRVRDGA